MRIRKTKRQIASYRMRISPTAALLFYWMQEDKYDAMSINFHPCNMADAINYMSSVQMAPTYLGFSDLPTELALSLRIPMNQTISLAVEDLGAWSDMNHALESHLKADAIITANCRAHVAADDEARISRKIIGPRRQHKRLKFSRIYT